MARSPFDELRPRTPRAGAIQRERIVMAEMAKLAAIKDEETVRKILKENYGIEPGTPKSETILRVWREISTLP
jgi:hypothetical protein